MRSVAMASVLLLAADASAHEHRTLYIDCNS